jgi:hypothetical protein
MSRLFPKIFLGLMGLAFCKTGIETLIDPQAVLSQVGIVLDNASALSSIRAVYGGMHVVFGLFCFYGTFQAPSAPLTLVLLYTAGFTLGRLAGIILDGTPNSFVTTWMITEGASGMLAGLALYFAGKSAKTKTSQAVAAR